MKFRILEKNAGNEFYIQIKRKFWPFWYNGYEYGNHIKWKNNHHGAGFSPMYSNYKDAKDDLDRMTKYQIEFIKRKKAKYVVRDEINLDKDSDKFLESL